MIQIASTIKAEFIPNTPYIGLKTYSHIIEGAYKLVKDESKKLTFEARANQRANIKDDAKYLATINEYLLNFEALAIEGQRVLGKKIGLGDTKLEESELLMIDRGLGNNMLVLQSQMRAKLK